MRITLKHAYADGTFAVDMDPRSHRHLLADRGKPGYFCLRAASRNDRYTIGPLHSVGRPNTLETIPDAF